MLVYQRGSCAWIEFRLERTNGRRMRFATLDSRGRQPWHSSAVWLETESSVSTTARWLLAAAPLCMSETHIPSMFVFVHCCTQRRPESTVPSNVFIYRTFHCCNTDFLLLFLCWVLLFALLSFQSTSSLDVCVAVVCWFSALFLHAWHTLQC